MSKKNTKQQEPMTRDIEPLVRYQNLIPYQRHRLLVILRFLFSGFVTLTLPYLLNYAGILEQNKVYDVLSMLCSTIAIILFINGGLIAFTTIKYMQITNQLAQKHNIDAKIVKHIVAQANVYSMVSEDNEGKYTHLEMKDKTIFDVKTGKMVEKIEKEDGTTVWVETNKTYEYYKIFKEALKMV